MAILFGLLLSASLLGIFYGSYHGISNLLKKNRRNKKSGKRIILGSTAALIISFIGIGTSSPSPNETESISYDENFVLEEDWDAEALELLDEEHEQLDAELLIAQQTEEQELFNLGLAELRDTLADLVYEDVQTIELNENIPIFGPLDLSLEDESWEFYGDLDPLNRATAAEAMLNQDLMPTEKRVDISSIEPTGWKNKKVRNRYLYNRSHLIGFTLSGENDNRENLITGTSQLNNPEMLRHEMDIKHYLEQSETNYVRYSVTPIFKDDELLARGVHLMAQSITDDSISFNVYIFNIQEGVDLNYLDGSSVTDEELAAQALEQEKQEEERIAREKEEATRVAAEKEQQAAIAKQAEQDRIAAEQQAEANRIAEAAAHQQPVGQTVYVATDSGTKYHFDQYCRGLSNANSVTPINLSQAQAEGYGLCGWED